MTVKIAWMCFEGCPSTLFADRQPSVSWIEPVLEFPLEAVKHLFFDVSNVSELTPASHVQVLKQSLNLVPHRDILFSRVGS
jgi:hypothetical protein